MIYNNSGRVGNFTSSEIFKLFSIGSRKMTDAELAEHKKASPGSRKTTIDSWPGDAAKTYIEECNMERRLGRPIESESNARALAWGKLLESRAFELLGLEYQLVSQETMMHPEIACWGGSPDANKFDDGGTVIDIKCPITLKSFCTFIDAGTIDKIRKLHKDGEKYYWQIVSNAILTNAKYGELIIYVPYESELDAIRPLSEGNPKYYWIWGSQDEELPFLPDGGHYKNLNVIRFEIPQEDKDKLTRFVQMGSKLLINPISQKN